MTTDDGEMTTDNGHGMLNDDTLKALIEAILYVAPEPVTLDAIAKSIEGEERERVKAKLEELVEDFERADHGIHVRQVAGGYKFSSKVEHHDTLRRFVKSLKPPIRLSKPALETLAVIAYRQPVTLPEIEQIRGVDGGGVVHTLLERKLVVTAGRKNVVGRPILYRTSRDFLVHFGLKDLSELPSLREFEEMARQALGTEFLTPQEANATQPQAMSQESTSGRTLPTTAADSPSANSGQNAARGADEPAPPKPNEVGRASSIEDEAPQLSVTDTKPATES
jgi:segregation and condensation protein B